MLNEHLFLQQNFILISISLTYYTNITGAVTATFTIWGEQISKFLQTAEIWIFNNQKRYYRQTEERQKPITEAPLIVILMKCKVEQANMISVSVHLN